MLSHLSKTGQPKKNLFIHVVQVTNIFEQNNRCKKIELNKKGVKFVNKVKSTSFGQLRRFDRVVLRSWSFDL